MKGSRIKQNIVQINSKTGEKKAPAPKKREAREAKIRGAPGFIAILCREFCRRKPYAPQ